MPTRRLESKQHSQVSKIVFIVQIKFVLRVCNIVMHELALTVAKSTPATRANGES